MAPWGKGKNSAIAAFDVARAITEILSDPTEHIGQIYHLTGPVSQDMDAVAREFSAALGRTITYVDVPPFMALRWRGICHRVAYRRPSGAIRDP